MSKKQKNTTSKKALSPPRRHLSKSHAKVYWPYLPLVLLLIGSLFLNVWLPLQSSRPATLAYATEMSHSGLLTATNSQRAGHGRSALSLNSKLNAAAQAKANDMVARNYWSHNTPDGQEPWVFFDAQGYVYKKAGENLAYGFATSEATVIGWMNSPSHKANLLDSAFSEVGFGFANGQDYVGTGNETVVVAMYAQPYVASAPSPAPAQPAAPQTQNSNTSQTPATEPQAEKPIQQPEEEKQPEFTPIDSGLVNQPVTSDTVIPTDIESQRITKLQQLTGGRAPWAAAAVSIFALALALVWLFKHYRAARRIFIEGEHFIAHHPVFDVIVVSVVALAVYLSQSSGVVL